MRVKSLLKDIDKEVLKVLDKAGTKIKLSLDIKRVKYIIIDTNRPTITSGPKEHESNSEVEIADWSIYTN